MPEKYRSADEWVDAQKTGVYRAMQKLEDARLTTRLASVLVAGSEIPAIHDTFVLKGDRVGIFKPPSQDVSQRVGSFFQSVVNGALEIGKKMGEVHGKNIDHILGDKNFDLKVGRFPNVKAQERVRIASEAVQAEHRGYDERLHGYDQFSDFVARLVDITQKGTIPQYVLDKSVQIYVPHSPGIDGQKVPAYKYDFKLPALVTLRLHDTKTRGAFLFTFFPIAYGMYPGRPELDGIDPGEAGRILHDRIHNLDRAEEVRSIVEAGSGVYKGREFEISYLASGGVFVGGLKGEVVEKQEGGETICGANLFGVGVEAGKFSTDIRLPTTKRFKQVGGETLLLPFEQLTSDVLRLGLKDLKISQPRTSRVI